MHQKKRRLTLKWHILCHAQPTRGTFGGINVLALYMGLADYEEREDSSPAEAG